MRDRAVLVEYVQKLPPGTVVRCRTPGKWEMEDGKVCSTIYHPMMLPSGKKLGLVAVLFFTIKGLLWLIVPFVIYQWGC